MHQAVAVKASNRTSSVSKFVRAIAPSAAEISLVTASALLVVLSFPNFDLWILAWLGLAPLLIAVVGTRPGRAFVLGLWWGILFFYGTCWWLTYSMIRYGHI